PINPMNRTAELQHYLADTGAAVAICSQEVFPALQPLIGTESLRHVVVAAYNDYVREPTDLKLPEAVAEPARAIEHPGVALWKDVLAAGHVPGPHTAT